VEKSGQIHAWVALSLEMINWITKQISSQNLWRWHSSL